MLSHSSSITGSVARCFFRVHHPASRCIHPALPRRSQRILHCTRAMSDINSVLSKTLFVEIGTGADGHGQDVTKAARRACRNAIEFNSLPSLGDLIPGGKNNMKLHVKIGSPHPEQVDTSQLANVFPYGAVHFEVVHGGLSCSSGIALPELGDTSDEMVVVVACVSVGY